MTRINNPKNQLPDANFRFARVLLLVSIIMLPWLALSDINNDYLVPAYAKVVVILICLFGYFLSRKVKYHQYVRFSVATALIIMATVGAFYKLDSFHGLVWIPVLPLLFCFIVGVRNGIMFSAVYLCFNAFSYFSFEFFHQIEPVSYDSWLQALTAFFFVLLITVLFQKEIKKSEQHLKEVAKRDYLTQLLNRRGFLPRLEDEVERAIRYDGTLSVILVDVDNFKRVNDEYGHGVGDQLLVMLAKLLEKHTRASDLVGRWGGEEFIILTPNTNLIASQELAEKLRYCVASSDFPEVGHVTASFGVAASVKKQNWEQLVERADTCLYQAKQAGKNKVVSVGACSSSDAMMTA